MSPITSALALLPETLTVAPAGVVVGVIAGVTGRYIESVWIGWALTTLGTGLLHILDIDTTTGQWIGLNIPVGIGTGMLFPALALSIQAACVPSLNAQAAAFFSFIRVFGQAIGVAISGVIFQNAFRDELIKTAVPELVAAADIYSRDATQIVTLLQTLADQPGEQELSSVLKHAYNESLRAIWITLVSLSAFALLLSATIKRYSLSQEHVTDQHLIEDVRAADEEVAVAAR